MTRSASLTLASLLGLGVLLHSTVATSQTIVDSLQELRDCFEGTGVFSQPQHSCALAPGVYDADAEPGVDPFYINVPGDHIGLECLGGALIHGTRDPIMHLWGPPASDTILEITGCSVQNGVGGGALTTSVRGSTTIHGGHYIGKIELVPFGHAFVSGIRLDGTLIIPGGSSRRVRITDSEINLGTMQPPFPPCLQIDVIGNVLIGNLQHASNVKCPGYDIRSGPFPIRIDGISTDAGFGSITVTSANSSTPVSINATISPSVNTPLLTINGAKNVTGTIVTSADASGVTLLAGSGAPISRLDLTVLGPEATGWTAANILSGGVVVTEGRVLTPQADRTGFEITNNQVIELGTWYVVDSFANGWENAFSPAFIDEAAYLKDAEGFVHIRGHLRVPSTPSTPAFRLPSGFYTPGKYVFLPGFIRDDSTNTQVAIDWNGWLSPIGGTYWQEFVINNLKLKP